VSERKQVYGDGDRSEHRSFPFYRDVTGLGITADNAEVFACPRNEPQILHPNFYTHVHTEWGDGCVFTEAYDGSVMRRLA